MNAPDDRPALLLWDIDGTLLQGAAAGHGAAMHLAMERVFGVADRRRHAVAHAGRTDLEIARELLALEGVALEQQALDDLERAWVSAYREIAEDDLSDRVAPGMLELLSRLAGCSDVRLSLLSGNLEPIARLKLERAGIGRFFATGQGAFGSDSERRAELPTIARGRAGDGSAPWPRRRTVIIGDTPLDIACARADGIGVLALAGGPYGVEELRAADGAAADVAGLVPLIEAVVAG